MEVVPTSKGVTLRGRVADEARRDRWVAIAQGAFGADRVIDRLEILPGANWPEGFASVADLMQTLAESDGGVRAVLHAATDVASVRLTGSVGSDDARSTIERKVRAALPTVKVINEIEVDRVQGQLQSELDTILRGTTIEFRTGSATLTREGRAVLDRVIEPLRRATGYRSRIQGHTDSTGDAAMNLRLSQARAQSVLEYLVAHGIDRSTISSEGFGETRPIADNATAQGRQRNRRIEFRLVRENQP